MRLSYLVNAISLIMMYIGLVLLVPIVVALIYHDHSSVFPFLNSAIISAGCGYLMRKIVPSSTKLENLNDIKKSEGLFIVAASWVIFALIAAIPYPFYNLSIIDSLFEATSGITTTGATILTHYDYPKAFMFWRSFTQWLGGMGIIVMFIAILPQFAVAGRQMFFAEAPGPTEDKFTPRVRNTASILWKLYLGLTLILITALIIAGMPAFDAVCNALSTISAGGFSPNEYSIMGYNIPSVTWIICIFMIIAGTSFNLQFKTLQTKNPLTFVKDEEFRAYFIFIAVMSAIIASFLVIQHNYDLFGAIKHSMFQVVSVMTSSGFASVDYTKWTYSAQVFLLIAMFFSSCSSSAGGGLKVARLMLIFKIMKNEIEKILHPNAVIPVKHNGNVVPQDVLRQVVIFVFQYFSVLAVTAVVLTIIEQNHTLGLTSAVSSLGNIGPAFGQIGPMNSFEHLHTSSKIILIFNMLVGRLELIPFIVMLNPEFWSFKSE